MKLIIAGGRDFDDYEMMCMVLDEDLFKQPVTEVVCGEAKGADALGKRWAIEHKIPVTSYPAKWDFYGPAAGPIRNAEMARYTDTAIVFWDGKSFGTSNMIANMERLKKPFHVIKYP